MEKTLTFKPRAVPRFPAGSFAVSDWEPFGVQFGDYLGPDDHLRSEFFRRCTGPCDKKGVVIFVSHIPRESMTILFHAIKNAQWPTHSMRHTSCAY